MLVDSDFLCTATISRRKKEVETHTQPRKRTFSFFLSVGDKALTEMKLLLLLLLMLLLLLLHSPRFLTHTHTLKVRRIKKKK